MSQTCSWPGFKATLAEFTIAARFIEAFGADKLACFEVLGCDGVFECATYLAVLLKARLVQSEGR